ncbi:NAD(P)H-quinone oxidoreductase subunit N, chloroplastic isoform X3 [Cryptomeria japonica]|uniref:NAD(P)H-quinone oxidoreductase subunit N, chloroplastic isoform X3 n=1 Tax=Cryptomeria japonica TaxID=3369 RepID=UPI0025AD1E3F|nr:NAD(P)H-quinone oxidoreductase subunit N, chloroplastic isoform X3 [Cryptomeria japonica]
MACSAVESGTFFSTPNFNYQYPLKTSKRHIFSVAIKPKAQSSARISTAKFGRGTTTPTSQFSAIFSRTTRTPTWQFNSINGRSTREAPTRKHTFKVDRFARAPTRQFRLVRCGIEDFVGGDLLGFDLGNWYEDVEKYKAIAIYPPHEGGYSGRYATKLRYEGYHLLNLTARGLGDLETYLTKVHAVRPVLSKTELQFLALLPTLRPKVRVIAQCGNWRKFKWKPLREIIDLPSQEKLLKVDS